MRARVSPRHRHSSPRDLHCETVQIPLLCSYTPVREFSPPYSYGDARDVLQVKKGRASIEDLWQQPRGYNDVPSRDENGGVTWTWEELSGSIRTSITPHGDIQIAFSEEGAFIVLLPDGRK